MVLNIHGFAIEDGISTISFRYCNKVADTAVGCSWRMRRLSPASHILAVFNVMVAALLLLEQVCGALPTTILQLERIFPLEQKVDLGLVRTRDRVRHGEIMQRVSEGVVNLPVRGSADPLNPGLYFTTVKLGNPPREFKVQIDTGSDVLWIACRSCTNCPTASGLGIKLGYFDPASSSTASIVSCSDPMCTSGVPTAAIACLTDSNQCSYSFRYGDGSGTSGFYVTDMLHFDMILGPSYVVNSSAFITFGCSTEQSGDLIRTEKAIDGIFGFGRGILSAVSQLSSRDIIPRVFSHCLKGDGSGGGLMILGEILEPNIVYSPLLPSKVHYNLNMQSISVNEKVLPIDPSVFVTSSSQGTIIDSGTTLAYLLEDAYDHFVAAITSAVSQRVTLSNSNGSQCYLVNSSILEIFPPASLNFEGDAFMTLTPTEYLIYTGLVGGATQWCIGFQKIQQGIMILGDLVLKDKIFVYDLAQQRIGWADYDCSRSVNVSLTYGRDEPIDSVKSTSSGRRYGYLLFQLVLSIFMVMSSIL